ncbi:MAG: glycine cleavage system protein GcvH [bacterium]
MIPQDLKFTREHEWVRLEGDHATVGISQHAADLLGEIVFVELPEAGQMLSQMKTFGVVESVKSVSDLYAPLSGEVLKINGELQEHPEYVNQEPYGRGWMLVFKIQVPSEISKLMGPDDYEKLLEEAS